MKKIAYFVAEDYYFYSHRLPIAQAARDEGYEVYVITRPGNHATQIIAEGFHLLPIEINRSSLSIKDNFLSLIKIRKILSDLKPDLLHNVAVKPIVLGTLASLGISKHTKILNAFAGMGFVYSSKQKKARFLKWFLSHLYKMLLRSKRVTVLCQNTDDVNYFNQHILKGRFQACLIPGSGINVNAYTPLVDPLKQPFTVLMASRLLKDKGIYEFIEAAKQVKLIEPSIRFLLAGDLDAQNPSSLNQHELSMLVEMGVIEWLGHVSNIRDAFKLSHVVVLPSYREGLPKVLLEASACQKAIVTTDAPGCRELIKHEVNGLLVRVQSSSELSEAILNLYRKPDLRQSLAIKARESVCSYYSDTKIKTEFLELYDFLLS